jgi:hypothetical protein
MPPPDQMRALSAAEKFIRTHMTSADLSRSCATTGSSVDMLQDFTDDRNRLLSILETMVVGEGQGDDDVLSDDSSSDTGAAFGQDDSEFNIFTTDRQLSALQTAVEMLEHLNEKKELIYFASGLTLNGLDNQAQLHATEDAAIRAGVAFWPIDARGLVAHGADGRRHPRLARRPGDVYRRLALAMTSASAQSQDTLYALAGDTGGKAFLDNNDLSLGIVAGAARPSPTTTSSATTPPTHARTASSARSRSPSPEHRRQARLSPGLLRRQGVRKFTTADKERQLEDALMQGDPVTELTIAMEINYFQLNRAEYLRAGHGQDSRTRAALAKKRGADHT